LEIEKASNPLKNNLFEERYWLGLFPFARLFIFFYCNYIVMSDANQILFNFNIFKKILGQAI